MYRFRRTTPMQRILAPFHNRRDMQIRPYQNMEKSHVGMAPDMTGETLVGVNTMREAGTSGSLPNNSTRAVGTGVKSHLTLDAGYLGPATSEPVSPVSTVSGLAPEVSPISPAFPWSNDPPLQHPLRSSTVQAPHMAVSMAGSEARIVRIPPRSSRTLTGEFPPGSSGDRRPRIPSSVSMSGRPSGQIRNYTGGAGNGGVAMPAQQRSSASAEFRPPPLSINRSKQTPLWSKNVSRPAGDLVNAGYKPYRPLMDRKSQRVSQASVSDVSIASSDVFSLTDAISWPKPPRTPTASPDRHE